MGEQNYFLDLYDDGSGVPADFDIRRAKSLGLQIVRTLIVDDMGGTFTLINDRGTHDSYPELVIGSFSHYVEE